MMRIESGRDRWREREMETIHNDSFELINDLVFDFRIKLHELRLMIYGH